MTVADVHPSVEELAAFTLGTLDDETQASIEAHVAACAACQECAAVAPADNLVELVRRVGARTGRRADTFVDTAAQVQAPAPLPALAETEGLASAVAPSGPAEPGCPMAPDALPPELTRHERYRVVRLVGVGGMGAVYEAEHRVMQRPVALKVIKRAYTADAAALGRFRREVRAAARLSHPNIVITYDAEDAGDTHFLVMEYVEGTDLGRLVQEGGPLPVDRACEYVRQAALGLQYAFEHDMVHRDLKPHNLMRTPDGHVKILDFGLARLASEAAEAAGLTSTGIVLGTVDYIAPEQADNAHQADIRSDIYSLGCTLYHLLAGQPPFPTGTSLQKVMAHMEKKPQPLTELRDDLPEELMPVLERMMAKDPKHRYQTPAEVAFALEPFLRATAVARAPRRRTLARTTDPSRTVVLDRRPVGERRRPRLATATAILAFLVAGLLGVSVYRIATDDGELVIRTENEDVDVVVSKGGKVVKIIDTKSGKHVTLNSGDYELALKNGKDELKISPVKMTVKRGETVLATITTQGASKYYCLNLQTMAKDELDKGNDRFLAALPKGEQDFAGVKFNIGARLIELPGESVYKVEGIKVGVTCRKLHFLHACHAGGRGPGDGTTIAYYKVTYDDKSQETIPIVYGKNILNWWFTEGDAGPTEARIAWTGDNADAIRYGRKVRLYLATWTNREPTKRVVSIDFGITKAIPFTSPFCVAITAEK